MAEQSDSPRLSVIIVTWNVRDYTLTCLEALARETRDIATEVIVVDNASSDGTVEAVRQAYPTTRVLANDANVGFPIANNQALALARGEYVLFLNPDTEVGPGSIRACIAELDADAGLGMAGCRVLLEDGRIQPECARRPYLLRHLAAETLYLHMLFPRSRLFGDHLMGYWDKQDSRDVEAICGAFMLARTHVARKLGGLPDDIFMYHEDLAFCGTMRRHGWRIRYVSEVTTLHRHNASGRKSTAALALLEGVCKIRLVRDEQGPLAAAAGRVLFGARCMIRLTVAVLAAPLPLRRLKAAYPRVFDVRTHALQLVWTVAPALVRHLVPAPPRSAPVTGGMTPVRARA
jgi:GT2 family glycosyltransferase